MNILLWVLQILLGLMFLFAGASKFMISAEDIAKASPVAFPHWFFLFIGVCEFLGGLGLILPWALKIKPGLTPLAASLLIIIMIGAAITSAMGGISNAIAPVIVGLLLAVVAYGRSRKSTD